MAFLVSTLECLLAAVFPVNEVISLAQRHIPSCRPLPPPFPEDERFTDRIALEDIQALDTLARALGLSYLEVQRYLRCFCCLDSLRQGRVSIRQLTVHWNLKHTPLVDFVFSQLVKPKEPPSDSEASQPGEGEEEALPGYPRFVDATRLFMALWEFCSLTRAELCMFIFHCVGVHEPLDLPTPAHFLQRLVRLLHGSEPSVEIKQLLRCLRCLPESPPPAVRWESDGHDSLSTGHPAPHQSPTTQRPLDHTMTSEPQRRPFAHDDTAEGPAQRYSACCEILLRFPILVQPAVSLQRTLRRKVLGEAFWRRAALFRRALPLSNRRVALPPLTPARIIAARDEMQARMQERGQKWKQCLRRADPDSSWMVRKQGLKREAQWSGGDGSLGKKEGRNRRTSPSTEEDGTLRRSSRIDPLWMLGEGYEAWMGLSVSAPRAFMGERPGGLGGRPKGLTDDDNDAQPDREHGSGAPQEPREPPPVLRLWPPLGLVAEALTSACASPNHAWFLSSSNLLLMVLNPSRTPHRQAMRMPAAVLLPAEYDAAASAAAGALAEARRDLLSWYLATGSAIDNVQQQASNKSSSLALSIRFEDTGSGDATNVQRPTDSNATDVGREVESARYGVQSLEEWFDLALVSSDGSNAMLCGVWNASNLALAARESTFGRGAFSDLPEGVIASRMKAETAAGSLPGAAAPQPFAPLLATPADYASDAQHSRLRHVQNIAGGMLGFCRELKTERAVVAVSQSLARMTRSFAFGQFIVAASAVRRDSRLDKSLSLVFDDKQEPFDQKFWVKKRAEVGPEKGNYFFVNIRTGVRTRIKPSFIRKKENEGEPAYIRIW